MRRTEAEYIAAGKNRSNYVDILTLASELSEDEFHCMTYVFHSPVATITLIDDINDADVTVSVTVPGQLAPLFHTEILDCKDIVPVNDKRGQYLEFTGKILNEECT
ncbi:hypothetical protein [Undibacterium sp. TS12]|uniref:hypothetical protein n=1 Tax=Undibacterium sp. TS12 TaxID=2908202 RepID=UPI001F4D01C2|nr:hypothetical protein [Undibacterium sp. TS12]MCH8622806.1 hypothetical protein [Undibacterium sp. TS12]